jgi:hypothetical protein
MLIPEGKESQAHSRRGIVLNLCSQFPFSSLRIVPFCYHFSLRLGFLALKNQFVFGS